jgi:GDPmannose 4,6-dehydratase
MENIIITGVTGQAGSIFCDYLLKKTDYNLIGVARRCSNPNYVNVEHLFTNPRFKLVTGDITDYASIASIVKDFQPKYFANCAAQSHVHESWKTPLSTFDINVNGVANCLESIRLLQPDCRFITFSSSEMFGDNHSGIININTPLSSKSPYGCSKVAAHHMVKVYRESYGLYAVGGIMFNYEGPRRSKQFVTRKITSNVARIKKEKTQNL